jgi:hypothetical protein
VQVDQTVCDGCTSVITAANASGLSGDLLEVKIPGMGRILRLRVTVTLAEPRDVPPLCVPCARSVEATGGSTGELCDACRRVLTDEADLCEHCLREVMKEAGVL